MNSIEKIKSEIAPIKSNEQYRYYLSLIDELIDCKENSKEEELLELISIIVENYEAIHYKIEAPDPIEAIKFKIEEMGLKKKDLAIYFGSVSRVSEILNKKRQMTFEMAKKIHHGLGISAEILMN